jgi:hypothetical protein
MHVVAGKVGNGTGTVDGAGDSQNGEGRLMIGGNNFQIMRE